MTKDYRIESDTLGEVKVPKDALWGAQTGRSRHNFPTGPLMPVWVIKALINVKLAAAKVNAAEGELNQHRADLIEQAAEKLLNLSDADLMKDFPLHVYQTGSGTQTNMNVNEVLAHVANQIDPEAKILPNDDVNYSQSSNDTFPTAMNIAGLKAVQQLLPELERLIEVFDQLSQKYWDVVKIGRTHLQDATPLTFGQEISGWSSTLKHDVSFIKMNANGLLDLPIGGTAVGTGLNAEIGFDQAMVTELGQIYGEKFKVENKFYGLAAHTALTNTHGAISTLATDLMKISNDIRFLASGPRAGYGEISIPANEPGSSIMPGKVNPTQTEAMTMAATRIMGNNTTIEVANSQGNFEMNVYKPVIIATFIESVELLIGLLPNYIDKLVAGIQVNEQEMKKLVDKSLMTVTALSPYIGYHNAASIAQLAMKEGLNLREAAVQSGFLSATDFDKWVDPLKMTNNQRK